MSEIKLMKGNEALAEAAIRMGADAYFGYPITPQSEVIEYLMSERPEQRTGMVVLQAESEIAAINMVYGAASTGKRVMTSSSSPGISLKMEGISYLAGAELPAVIVNVVRGGPGLGTIQPSQADYFQAVKGGGHGDFKLYVLAPASVQEMADFVEDAFDIAFKYRAPVMILSDGVIGQMMEKVKFKDQQKRTSDEEIIEKYKNRRFKFASKNFYGCFLAASEIGANYKKYFPDLVLFKPIKFNKYKLKRYIKPAKLMKSTGITKKDQNC